MNELEKVEKLRERANVTYEEAKNALDQCNGDLLEAMVMLERQGKVKGPEQTSYSTSYEEQPQYLSVEASVEDSTRNRKGFWQKCKDFIHMVWKKGSENYFCISHKNENVFKIPVFIFVLIILCAWEFALVALILGLFFDCKYSFAGKDELNTANHVFDKASEFAEQVKEEIQK